MSDAKIIGPPRFEVMYVTFTCAGW